MKRSFITTLVPLLAIALYLGGRYFYFQPKFIQGEKAPAFSTTLKDGTSFSLSDLEGQYVLLDFWGSWCGPCRKQNPHWVALYDQMSGKNFTIVSVGVEKDAARWASAIRQDGLSWKYHIFDELSNTRFFDGPLAKLYGVKQVPTSFLVNPKGVIIATDPQPEEVAKILERLSIQNMTF